MYHFHLKYGLNGRQAKELILFDVKSAIEQTDYDCSKFEGESYRLCADDIEKLFLPEKNPLLKASLKEGATDEADFFELP